MNEDEAFVGTVVKAIVDHPDDVKTKRSVDEMGVLIELTVNAEDMGKIIGKEGRTAKSIRTLLRVLGAKNNARVNLKIIEPEGGREVPVAKTEETKATTEKVSENSPAGEGKSTSAVDGSLEEGQATEVV